MCITIITVLFSRRKGELKRERKERLNNRSETVQK